MKKTGREEEYEEEEELTGERREREGRRKRQSFVFSRRFELSRVLENKNKSRPD